jgi:hypothetical protein
MAHDEETAEVAQTERDQAILNVRVIGIISGQGKRVIEDSRRLFERHTVLQPVCARFIVVPIYGPCHVLIRMRLVS